MKTVKRLIRGRTNLLWNKVSIFSMYTDRVSSKRQNINNRGDDRL